MTFKLYSLSIAPLSTFGTNPSNLDTKLSTLGDWIRFNPTQWYIWTDRTKNELVSQVQATLLIGEQFIVVSLQPEFAQGSAPLWIWNWLNEKMAKQVIG
jgi:hypothetical protein